MDDSPIIMFGAKYSSVFSTPACSTFHHYYFGHSGAGFRSSASYNRCMSAAGSEHGSYCGEWTL